jgi:hypothetical protein
MTTIMEKLQVRNRVEAALTARRILIEAASTAMSETHLSSRSALRGREVARSDTSDHDASLQPVNAACCGA